MKEATGPGLGASSPEAPAPRPPLAKVLVASLVGSSVEWYDFFLYGTVASLVFNRLFFPSFDRVSGLLLAYATFAIPFFIRPLGGVVFSHVGDRVGRKNTLVATLTLMGTATVLIGLLPGYDRIGVAAPLLLVGLRLVQGLGIGGEWGGAMLLAVEYAPAGRRGLFGAVPQMGVTIGMLLGTLSMSLMAGLPEGDFLSWGWRVPFLLSAFLVFLGLWIRKGIDETPAFRQARESGRIARIPILETFRHQWRAVLVAVGAKVVETAPFYVFSTFVISYATVNLGFGKAVTLRAVTIATAVSTVLIPLMGALSDRLGRKTLYLAGTVAMAGYAFVYFELLALRSPFWLDVATVVGLGLVWAPITAVLGTLFSEIFPTGVRYTGITLGYQAGAALAGGTAPLVATALVEHYPGTSMPLSLYLLGTCLVSLLAVALARPIAEEKAAG